MSPESVSTSDQLLDKFWEKGLVLMGDRVREEYALKTPIFIDLRHKLYDDLEVLSELGRALYEKLLAVSEQEGRGNKPQQVIGIPDTATPLALATALASHNTSSPVGYGQMRKKPALYPGGHGVAAPMSSGGHHAGIGWSSRDWLPRFTNAKGSQDQF